jgi:RNA polymerase sigma-70 factor (ECF subfamily)
MLQAAKNIVAAADFRTQLNSRYHGPLTAYFIKRIRRHSDAEDLTQETLLRILRSPTVAELQHADAYVFTIASNLLKEYRRKSKRFAPGICVPIEQALPSELEGELVEDLTPERLLLHRDSLKEALRLLGELGERTRDIFVLFRLENVKQKDIATAFGISQSTVEKHVMRVVQHLAARQAGNKRCPAPVSRRSHAQPRASRVASDRA